MSSVSTKYSFVLPVGSYFQFLQGQRAIEGKGKWCESALACKGSLGTARKTQRSSCEGPSGEKKGSHGLTCVGPLQHNKQQSETNPNKTLPTHTRASNRTIPNWPTNQPTKQQASKQAARKTDMHTLVTHAVGFKGDPSEPSP